LSSKLGEQTLLVKSEILAPTYRVLEINHIANIGNLFVSQNEDSSLPSAVIFRDSFSTYLLELYAQTFSRLVCVWQPNIDYSIIERERPDVVISQQVERFLVWCPDDRNGLTNAEYVARKAQNILP
jgi:alginate O-acetyltransferase complex protein AlgJ